MNEKGIEDAVNAVKRVNEKNGVLFETQNVHDLTKRMMSMQNIDSQKTYTLRRNCLQEAKKYRPEATIQVLMDRL